MFDTLCFSVLVCSPARPHHVATVSTKPGNLRKHLGCSITPKNHSLPKTNCIQNQNRFPGSPFIGLNKRWPERGPFFCFLTWNGTHVCPKHVLLSNGANGTHFDLCQHTQCSRGVGIRFRVTVRVQRWFCSLSVTTQLEPQPYDTANHSFRASDKRASVSCRWAAALME